MASPACQDSTVNSHIPAAAHPKDNCEATGGGREKAGGAASSTRPPIKNARYTCCKLISFPFRHHPGSGCRITHYRYDEGADFGVPPVHQHEATERSV